MVGRGIGADYDADAARGMATCCAPSPSLMHQLLSPGCLAPVCALNSDTTTLLNPAMLARSQDAVVDTTGAGDSFIGSVLYGICTGMALPDTMRLAAVVAACKCTALGARPGLPTRQQLAPELLGSA